MKKIRIITNSICAALILAYVVVLALKWAQLPEQVPLHFDGTGAADKYGGKGSLIVQPVIAAFIFGIIAIVERVPSLWNLPVKVTAANRERVYAFTTLLLGIIVILVTVLILYSGICCMASFGALWPVLVFVGLILAVTFAGVIVLASMT